MTTVILWPQFETERSGHPTLLHELVAMNLRPRYAGFPETGETFAPSIFAGVTKVRPPRRVRHPKFGEGTIVAEKYDQLTIDFRRAGNETHEGCVRDAPRVASTLLDRGSGTKER